MESRRTPVSPSSRPAQASRLETLLYWALLGIVALRGLFFLVYSARTLLFHFPVDYDEGIILHSALRLAGGEAVYPPLEAHHFVSSVYTPLFYLLTAPFLRLIGPSLVPGRLVALLATLGSCALLAALVRAMGAGRRAAALVALMPLAFGTTLIWSTFAKPDTLSLFFGLLTLYWVVRYHDRPLVYLAALWFALGFFAKQNTPLLAGVGLLYLLLVAPRRGLLLGLLSGGAAAGPVLVLTLLTRGTFFLHTFGLHGLPWEWAHFWGVLEPLLAFLPMLVLSTLLALVVARRRQHLPAYLLLLGGLIFLAAGGRIGTNWSFHLPLLFAMALSTGLLLFPGGENPFSPRLRLVLLALVVLQLALVPNPLRWYRTSLLASVRRKEALQQVCTTLRATPPPVLSEDVAMLLLCGHSPRYDDLFLMAQLARAGRWDDRALVQDLQAERFSLVVLAYDLADYPPERTELLRWPPGPLAALRGHYRLGQEAGGLFLYLPRGEPGQGTGGRPVACRRTWP